MDNCFDNFSFESFFTLNDYDRKNSFWLEPFPGSNIKYPDVLTDDKERISTYKINKTGRIWDDLIYCGWPGLYIFSQKFRDLLEPISGIEFYSVHILDKSLRHIDQQYYGFNITGRCGAFIKSLSKEVLARRVITGPQFTKKVGLYFDPSTWDQSDFFVPKGTAYIFTTKTVNDIIINSQLTNIKMQPITQVETF